MSEPGQHNPFAPGNAASIEEVMRRIYNKDLDAIRVQVVGGTTETTTSTSTSTTTTAT